MGEYFLIAINEASKDTILLNRIELRGHNANFTNAFTTGMKNNLETTRSLLEAGYLIYVLQVKAIKGFKNIEKLKARTQLINLTSILNDVLSKIDLNKRKNKLKAYFDKFYSLFGYYPTINFTLMEGTRILTTTNLTHLSYMDEAKTKELIETYGEGKYYFRIRGNMGQFSPSIEFFEIKNNQLVKHIFSGEFIDYADYLKLHKNAELLYKNSDKFYKNRVYINPIQQYTRKIKMNA